MLHTLCADYLLSTAEGHRTRCLLSDVCEFDHLSAHLEPLLKDLTFVPAQRQFTDDTVQTLAVAQWLLQGNPVQDQGLEQCLKALATRYEVQVRGFGKTFTAWLHGNQPDARSASNGCLMRLEPILLASPNLDSALQWAWLSTRLTHRHPDAWKAVCLYVSLYFELMHTGSICSQERVLQAYRRQLLGTVGLEELREKRLFQLKAHDCLSAALVCVMGSRTHAQVLANVAYLGGDSDTVGVLACVLARPLLGPFPEGAYWVEQSLGGAPELLAIARQFEAELPLLRKQLSL